MRSFFVKFSVAAFLVGAFVTGLQAQRDWNTARGLVERSQRDLQSIKAAESMKGDERERYQNAMKHLSEFDQKLVHSHYDKDKLDESIEDINNVCKNNTLTPSERDVLLAD